VAGAHETSLALRTRQGRWGARLGALLAGAPLALAFPRPGWWWLALVGLVPVLLLAMTAPGGREAAVRA
jgi:apolipoprotein N-acyltransferase